MLRRPRHPTLFPYTTLFRSDVVKRAGGLDTEKVTKAWENAKFKTLWGAEVEMRACDHQMLTQGYVAEVLEPEKIPPRSEEHTSELQSRRDLVCRLLLEKKK